MKNDGKTGITGKDSESTTKLGSQETTVNPVDESSTKSEKSDSDRLFIEKPTDYFTDEIIENLTSRFTEFYFEIIRHNLKIVKSRDDIFLNIFNEIIEKLNPSDIEDFGTFLFYREVINGFYMSDEQMVMDRNVLRIFIFKYQRWTNLLTGDSDFEYYDYLKEEGIIE